MAKIIILGSSNAIVDRDHENTHLVIAGRERVALADCSSHPILRLERAGVGFNRASDLAAEARSRYQGQVSLAEDFTTLEF